jgi:hypothetical protein
MTSYDDIHTLDRITRDEFESGGRNLARAFGLSEAELGAGYEIWIARVYNDTPLYILYYAADGRAGLVHGGDAVWTDADSVTDAIERYFGDNGKAIVN